MKLHAVKKFCAKSILVSLLALLMFLPLSPVFVVPVAHADVISGTDWLNLAKNTITSTVTKIGSKLTDAVVQKEYIYDGIAWAAINILVEQMLQSTIDWVNSGFQGKPAFVEDFNGFLLDVTDRYALGFIWGGSLQALCSPFKVNIQFALQAQYESGRDGYEATCRLSTAIKNHEGFLNGDFIGGGGWDAFYDVSVTPSLSPMGALAESEAALSAGAHYARQQNLFEVGVVGQGWFSKEKCSTVNGEEKCRIVTPGQTIQGYLENTLSIPGDRLSVADELDELFGALVTQLASKVLGGAGGLRGSSGGGGDGEGRYFGATPKSEHDQVIDYETLEQQAIAENQQTDDSGTGVSSDEVQSMTEVDYLTLLNSAIILLESCNETQLPHNLRRNLETEREELEEEVTDVLTDRKQVSSADVTRFQADELPRLRQLVQNMPSRASCAI